MTLVKPLPLKEKAELPELLNWENLDWKRRSIYTFSGSGERNWSNKLFIEHHRCYNRVFHQLSVIQQECILALPLEMNLWNLQPWNVITLYPPASNFTFTNTIWCKWEGNCKSLAIQSWQWRQCCQFVRLWKPLMLIMINTRELMRTTIIRWTKRTKRIPDRCHQNSETGISVAI